ncbi:TLR4 interactor with leucine rich repeats [Neosynchiropus ocellatus]
MDTSNLLAGLFLLFASLHRFVSGFCPERCDCQNPRHVLCSNRGLQRVPEPSAASEEVLVLSLGGNFIGNISELDLVGYSDLIRLNLQYNQIDSIHPGAFQNLSKLEELYIGHNLLAALHPGTLNELKKLTTLYSNSNHIRRLVPADFSGLDRLVKLRLDGNAIEHLQDSVFEGLGGLLYLHLESNQLHHIHKNAFSKLHNLRYLNLDHNRQQTLRGALTFSHLTSLTTLLLSDNQIHHIGNHVFKNLGRLTKLTLSNNRLSGLNAEALRGLSSLREFHVDGNQLEEIPASLLDPLESLEVLDLSRNRISNVDPLAFKQLAHLKRLKLKSNKLKSLSGEIFALNDWLYDVDLHGNNWTCDCRMERLKRWMADAHSQGKLLTVFVQCHQPAALRGKYLDYVNSSQLLGTSWADSCLHDQAKTLVGGFEQGLQGDQSRVELEKTKPMMESLRPKSRTTKETSGKRVKGRSDATSRTDSLVFSTPQSLKRSPTHSQFHPTTSPPVRSGGKFDLLRSEREQNLPVITDPCVFNRLYITNVTVDQVTSSSVNVYWTTRGHRRYTLGTTENEVHYRILYDRFGTADRFPRYVYASGSARSVTLQELSSDVTYMVCVEGVVGGSVCHLAPRDHCSGLVTLPEGRRTLTSDLQLVTVITLACNALLLTAIGGVWLVRSLKKRMQRRKSAVHVRHMYSTRRPFRPNVAAVSSDFTCYQSSRPSRLGPLEEDLIEFPCERFQENSCARRDSDLQRFSD